MDKSSDEGFDQNGHPWVIKRENLPLADSLDLRPGKVIQRVTLMASAADDSHDTDVVVRATILPWTFQHSTGGGWAAASAVSVTAIGSFDADVNGVPITVEETALPDPNAHVTGTFDRQSRIHSIGVEPALVYSDGRREWYWHGVKVPQGVITNPEDYITVERIEKEDNAEVRRVMLERFGIANYLAKCKAKLRHTDETGELYERKFGRYEDPLVFVKVKNSTPEPDGSIKDYFLRVPPDTKTARAGVAWTFRMTEKQYAPAKET